MRGVVERYREARRRILDEFEVTYLKDLLEQTQGNVREAARRGQIDRSYLIQLLDRHQLR